VELVGFSARVASIKHLDNRNLFTVQTVLLLVAPAVMTAACYMAFGRIVLWVVPSEYQSTRYLWLPARRITPIFVSGDVLSFFVQVIGGALVAGSNTSSGANTGRNIVLAGLGMQLFTFGFFVIASVRFSVILRTRLRKVPLPKDTNWPLLLNVVNAACILILVRSAYRLIGYALGLHNYLSDHEVWFYCLDALIILIVAATYVVVHPGLYLPYLGIRRETLAFSRNVGRGPFSKLSSGKREPVEPLRSLGNDYS
jgi:RTA1 like protein